MVPKSGMQTNQMNGLYPIIRRVWRPLVQPDGRPVGLEDAKPAAVAVQVKPEPAPGRQGEQRKNQHGKATTSEPRK